MLKKALLVFIVTFALLEISLQLAGIYAKNKYIGEISNTLPHQGEIVILTLGESTTQLGGADSYPAILEKILNEGNRSRKYKVINLGVAGSSSDYALKTLVQSIPRYKPAIVLFMSGVNDDWRNRETVWGTFLFDSPLRSLRLVGYAWANMKSYWDKKPKRVFLIPEINKSQSPVSKEDRELALFIDSLKRLAKKGSVDDVIERVLTKSPLGQKQRLLHEAYSIYHPISLKDAQKIARAGIGIDGESYLWPYYELCRSSMILNDKEGAVQAFIDAQRFVTNVPSLNELYFDLNKKFGDDQRVNDVMIRNGVRDPESYSVKFLFNQRTRENLKDIAETLLDNQIIPIAIQYPMLNASYLHEVLAQYAKAIVVDNESVFKKAVESKGYEAIFKDRFGFIFGHATPAGNRILAENIYKTLMEYGVLSD